MKASHCQTASCFLWQSGRVFVAKLIADWTGCLQLKHPVDSGLCIAVSLKIGGGPPRLMGKANSISKKCGE